ALCGWSEPAAYMITFPSTRITAAGPRRPARTLAPSPPACRSVSSPYFRSNLARGPRVNRARRGQGGGADRPAPRARSTPPCAAEGRRGGHGLRHRKAAGAPLGRPSVPVPVLRRPHRAGPRRFGSRVHEVRDDRQRDQRHDDECEEHAGGVHLATLLLLLLPSLAPHLLLRAHRSSWLAAGKCHG